LSRPRRPSRRDALAALVVSLGALVLAAPAAATPQVPMVRSAFSPTVGPRLSEQQAIARFVAVGKVASWLDRYPSDRTRAASYDRPTDRWKVHVWYGGAGEIATGWVDDTTGEVVEAWTGPQVAWKMARGGRGAFGGKVLDSAPIWFGLCAVFLVGL